MICFIGARVACVPAIAAINRKVEVDGEGTSPKSREDPERLEQGHIRRGSTAPLPNYVSDSSSKSGERPTTCAGDVKFCNLTFAYPTRKETDVLKGFILHVKSGNTVALVGPR